MACSYVKKITLCGPSGLVMGRYRYFESVSVICILSVFLKVGIGIDIFAHCLTCVLFPYSTGVFNSLKLVQYLSRRRISQGCSVFEDQFRTTHGLIGSHGERRVQPITGGLRAAGAPTGVQGTQPL